MGKTYVRRFALIAHSQNFSELEQPDGKSFDKGDDGSVEDAMYSSIQADSLLLNLLERMDDRDKIILMYQVLRESGFNLNHADCAKTLSISRERYMVLLKAVKKRSEKILQISEE